MTEIQIAHQLLANWPECKKPVFKHIKRQSVADGLAERVDDPHLINQGQTTTCGPTWFVFQEALHRPVEYVKLVTDLYDTGYGKLGHWKLKPCEDLKNYVLPAGAIAASDWIPIASLRDSGNWFFDYQSTGDYGGTTSHEVISWMKKAGYKKIVSDNRPVLSEDDANLQKASSLFDQGYKVLLRINADLLNDPDSTWSMRGNHIVALTSTVQIGPKKDVQMSLFSWGEMYEFPKIRTLPLTVLLKHYYGYVACMF